MKKTTKNLTLSAQTLRVLSQRELGAINGGGVCSDPNWTVTCQTIGCPIETIHEPIHTKK